MMGNIKEFAIFLLILIVVGAGTWYVATYQAETKIDYTTNLAQKELDSLSVVVQNTRQSRDQIEDSLEALDKDFSEYVLESNQKIANYTTVIGRLRIEKDQVASEADSLKRKVSLLNFLNPDSSLLALQKKLSLSVTNLFRDTLVSRTETWSDSLFATTAVAEFKSDSLLLSSRLHRLRDIRIDIVTTVTSGNQQVNTFVRSPDFDSLQVSATTELKPSRSVKSWAGWAVAAALAIWETIDRLR